MLKEMLMRIQKTNEQRAKMACTLVNVMKHSAHASIELRSTIACTFMEMLETSMIEEDGDMVKLIQVFKLTKFVYKWIIRFLFQYQKQFHNYFQQRLLHLQQMLLY